jgi:hypothetical protein
MNKGALDNCSIVINVLIVDWEPKHMTIGLFEAKVIIRIGLVNQLFEKYKLINKITCYMKDEGKKLTTMTTILKLNVSCEDLGIHAPFEGVVLAMPFLRLANVLVPIKICKFWFAINEHQSFPICNSSLCNMAKKYGKSMVE